MKACAPSRIGKPKVQPILPYGLSKGSLSIADDGRIAFENLSNCFAAKCPREVIDWIRGDSVGTLDIKPGDSRRFELAHLLMLSFCPTWFPLTIYQKSDKEFQRREDAVLLPLLGVPTRYKAEFNYRMYPIACKQYGVEALVSSECRKGTSASIRQDDIRDRFQGLLKTIGRIAMAMSGTNYVAPILGFDFATGKQIKETSATARKEVLAWCMTP